LKIWEKVLPGVKSDENPESNSFPLFGSLDPVPDVTVWATLSLLAHVTLSPRTFTMTGFGENAFAARVEAPGTIETDVPLVEVFVALAVFAVFAVLFLMSLSDGGVRSSFGSVITG
jgi:hypothetical protein